MSKKATQFAALANGDNANDFIFPIAHPTSGKFYKPLVKDVIGPVTVTTGTPSYTAPAGTLIEKIVIVGSTPGTLSIGSSSGATNIMDEIIFAAPQLVVSVDIYTHVEGTLFFNGMTSGMIIKLYKR